MPDKGRNQVRIIALVPAWWNIGSLKGFHRKARQGAKVQFEELLHESYPCLSHSL